MWPRYSFAILLKMIISSKLAIAKGKSFRTPVMNFWKYAGACGSLKGTLMYSYFPNGDLKAVLGVDDSSNRMW